jgi:hypothetical protein
MSIKIAIRLNIPSPKNKGTQNVSLLGGASEIKIELKKQLKK